ncbi:MAG: ABC transporter substrate-binding protein [Actinomycetales bacterium]|nr:MAG: ABC transporter substrate-binding protein [Actinomycetales bacterium]
MTARRLLPLVAALVASLALTACGSDDKTAASGDAAWSYTSANGDTITLDHKPKRIIASAAEAAGLLAYGIKPVGIYYAQGEDWEPGLQGKDLSGIKVIGKEWGKIDAEAAAELKPDLIVADWWPAQKEYQGFEEGADAASMKVRKLAPVIGANQQGSLLEVVEWYEGFAQSMDVDTESTKYASDKKAFDQAKADFQAAVKARPDVSALAVSPADDLLYVAVPKYSTSLTDFKAWGLDVVVPDSPKADFPYWEYLSWEKADKYQADLLMLDDRGYENTIKTGERQPTWDKIKAAKAREYTPWPGYWIHTYADYTEQLTTLTAAVEKADANLA